MMLRRRATPLGQKIIGSALALESAVRDGRYVFASRHGEMSRTIRVLSDMAAGDPPSPAEFSMCVHHGLAGLLSIHAGNRKGHTALAAGADSFGYGLLEAAACLAEILTSLCFCSMAMSPCRNPTTPSGISKKRRITGHAGAGAGPAGSG